MRIHAFPLVGLCLLTTLALGACNVRDDALADADAVPEAERYGGTVVVGGFGDLQSMNGLTSSDYNSNNIQRDMLFMTLLRYDADTELIPWLAERWDTVRVAPDTLEVTFHLRRDIHWHDGPPTTAEDVVFTYERMLEPRTAFPNRERMARYAPTAELVDSHTVRMRVRPHSDFLDIWTMTPIMPRHILGDVAPEQLLQHPFANEPVGNGPFRFVRRVPGQEWVFEANTEFPRALGGRPYVDRIVYRYIPEMTTLMTELLTGRLDMYIGPNPNQADQIQRASGVELRVYPSRQYNYLGWNTRLPFLSDPRTRRALTMAIDRRQIVDALVYGYGEVGRATVTPTHWAYDPDAMIPYDPEGARQLLVEVGWRPGPDGILRDPQGREFRFTLITNAGNDVRRDILEIVQAQLRPLGIVAQPRLVEWTTMIQQLQGSLNASGERVRNFDAVVSGWVNYHQKDDSNVLHSRNLNGPYQYVGYSNPRADALMDSLIVTMDRETARPMWREFQRLIAEEAPYTVIYYPERLTGLRTRLRGVELDVRGEFTSARHWWIPPAERQPGTRGATPGAVTPAADTAPH